MVNPVTYSLPYDVQTDFEPIALLTITPQLIIARKDFPAKDVKELVAWLKANPDKATAATVGAAGGAQVAVDLFPERDRHDASASCPTAAAGRRCRTWSAGQVDLMLDQAANALGPVRAGTVKAYAVMSKARWQALPDVPSIDESGTPGLYVAYWHAMWAPKGTPKDDHRQAQRRGDARARRPGRAASGCPTSGHDVFPREQQTPEALAAYHKAEIDKWWPIVRASGLKAQ